MTIEQFILKITENYSIEFQNYDLGYKFIVRRLTKNSELYQMSLTFNHDMLHDLRELHSVSFWEVIYDQIVQMMSEAMLNPYPVDPQQKPRQLVRYVTDFVKEHQISCGESIHQSDRMNLMAPEFMDKCCEIIGYYEEH
jgi:hypothetical protein